MGAALHFHYASPITLYTCHDDAYVTKGTKLMTFWGFFGQFDKSRKKPLEDAFK